MTMLYEPVKDRFVRLARGSRALRWFYYAMLNVVFLRSWYVRRAIRRVLSAHGSGPVDVLDAGTGLGQFASYIVRRFRNARVHAVDINASYLEYARSLIAPSPGESRVTFAVEDLAELRTSGPFDLVLSVDVMEHIEADVEVFRQFERVLRPGGYVIVNTPSDLGGSGVDREGEESFIGEHVREGYSREELSSKLEEAGLTVDEVVYTYGPAGSLAWRLMVMVPMKLISVSWLLSVIAAPYFVLVLPVGIVLNAVDVASQNERGTGLLVIARKYT